MKKYTFQEFEKRTAKWSSSDVVQFLMDGNDWHDAIMEYIKTSWDAEKTDFDEEDIEVYETLNKL
jgi:hypothetical protein|tara:strand:- start:1042 stop:1236 length:195 start_codon:yes stop_codon:yes gene_type:complete